MVGLAIAASGSVGLAATTLAPAHADPAYANRSAQIVGVGSDTIQDVFDAYTGADPYPGGGVGTPAYYQPLHSNAPNFAQIMSFDAIPAGGSPASAGCITTLLGGPAFDRPNGSSNGIQALVDAQSSTTPWKAGSGGCSTAAVNVQGQIDFARSSRGVKTTGSNLTFVPVARDAVSYAFWDHNTGRASSLTQAQLNSLYTNTTTGTITVNGDTIKACLPQSGSGTRAFFLKAIGVSSAAGDAGDITATNAANASGCGNANEENGANSFFTSASSTAVAAAAGVDAVIPFSAAAWISQANGVALDRSATGRTNNVDLGSITPSGGTALGKPYTGTPGSEAPVSSFYYNTTFGRDTYAVVPSPALDPTSFSFNQDIADMFSNQGTATAIVCQTAAANTRTNFGFLTPGTSTASNCGTTTLTGNL